MLFRPCRNHTKTSKVETPGTPSVCTKCGYYRNMSNKEKIEIRRAAQHENI